jgi:hypothetical protein
LLHLHKQLRHQQGNDFTACWRDDRLPKAGHAPEMQQETSFTTAKTAEESGPCYEGTMQFEAIEHSSPNQNFQPLTTMGKFANGNGNHQDTPLTWSVSAEPCSPFGSAAGAAAAAAAAGGGAAAAASSVASEDFEQLSSLSSFRGSLYPSSTVSSTAFLPAAGAGGYGALAIGQQQQVLEEELPSMPMPGLPTTPLTPAAAAWLNSILTSNKNKMKQQLPVSSQEPQLQLPVSSQEPQQQAQATAANLAVLCAPSAGDALSTTAASSHHRRGLDDIADVVIEGTIRSRPLRLALDSRAVHATSDQAVVVSSSGIRQWDVDVQMYKQVWGA